MSATPTPPLPLSARVATMFSALSIRLKLTAIVALGFLITFGVGFALVTANTSSIGRDIEVQNRKLVTNLLVGQMQAPLKFKDGKRLAEIFQPAINDDPSFLSAVVTHVDGEQLALFNRNDTISDNARTEVDGLIAQVLKTKKPAFSQTDQIYTIAAPISAGDGINLLGVVSFSWQAGTFLAAQYSGMIMTTLLSALVALAGLFATMLVISRLVTRPIGDLCSAMDVMSDHDYTVEIHHTNRQDEVGGMAKKLAEFRDVLAEDDAKNQARKTESALRQKLFLKLGESMSRLAGGRTDCPIDGAEFEALGSDHVEICDNFNNVLTNLRNMLSTIISTAESVRASSHEISEVAEEQSKRSEAQAATLQESAAAIDELNTSVQKSTGLASDANERIADNKKRAAAGGAVVDKTVKAMRNIEESSQQITAIIGVIDDIAFQTNLLALNAGVEAARAGESGRGFAVVASEVRALAQRASDSANEIKDLILRSSEHVTEGSDLANQAGAALNDIIDGVNHLSDMVSLIATGSSEQATNLAEIKESVTELDQVTQRNAAVIEESSAASRSLSHEAQRMTDALRQFDVDEAHILSQQTKPASASSDWDRELAAAKQSEATEAEPKLVFATRARSAQQAVAEQDDWHEF